MKACFILCYMHAHLCSPVHVQSDHPVLNSRYLLFEAQQAHYYGLPHNLALAAVTSTPAKIMGQDHRIGYIKEGMLTLYITAGRD